MFKFDFIFLILSLLTFVHCQEDDEGKTSKKTGKVASTDVTKYAGKYAATYYYNLDRASNTTQLPCKTVGEFMIEIPDGSSLEVNKDFSNVNGKDPMYNTQQGAWTVKELANSGEFDTLKIKVFIDDSVETIVCWGIVKQGNDIMINLNPNSPESCPTRFIPSYKTCLTDHAYIFGRCQSGVCAGEKPKASSGKGKGKNSSDEEATSNAVVNFKGSVMLVSALTLLSKLF